MDEINRRLDDHEERLQRVENSTTEFTTFREVINLKLEMISKNIVELKDAVVELKARPATLWDKVISAVIGAAVTAFIAYIISR